MEKVINAGITAIQLRCKDLEINNRYNIGLIIKKNIYKFKKDVLFIVNDRLDLATLLHADGVHIGKKDLPLVPVKKHYNNFIIGYSCNTIEDISFAINNKADYIGIGSIFPTTTKNSAEVIGIERLMKLKDHTCKIPSVAIGGINTENIHTLKNIPIDGVAISKVICSSSSPDKIIKILKENFNEQ
ncbi:MAG: thiamine phosphate synthase [Deferribacterota bacterium]|nr:thiamine phosphate synthase [Deferribacterota bacterium]